MPNEKLQMGPGTRPPKYSPGREARCRRRTCQRWVRAVNTVCCRIRMPVVADARHPMNWKRLSSAAERGIGAVTAAFPPDVGRRHDVSTTNRCIPIIQHSSVSTVRFRTQPVVNRIDMWFESLVVLSYCLTLLQDHCKKLTRFGVFLTISVA